MTDRAARARKISKLFARTGAIPELTIDVAPRMASIDACETTTVILDGFGHSALDGAATSTVLDGLGHGSALQEVTMDTIKSRFFYLGLQAGIALQMLAISVLMITSSSNAVSELSSLYYPLFRGLFLLGFFASMYGMLLFAWKRAGIDYAAILGVPTEHNYHSIIRAGFTLVSSNFACFLLYFLTLTVGLTRSKDIWPAAAFAIAVAYLAWPRSWMPEWNDADQRVSLARTIGRVLISPFSAPTFAHSFVADVFTSMPKCFFDLFYTVCIYSSGEAPWGAGEWHAKRLTFDNGLHICTASNLPYRATCLLLSVLPFWLRLMQCARGYYDSRDRRHLANGLKYCCVRDRASNSEHWHQRALLLRSNVDISRVAEHFCRCAFLTFKRRRGAHKCLARAQYHLDHLCTNVGRAD